MDDVLHALRVKGIATPEALGEALGMAPDAVLEHLRELEAEGVAFERPSRKRPGWVLSEQGRDRHAAELAQAHPPETRETLAELYEGFLALNNDVKALVGALAARGDRRRSLRAARPARGRARPGRQGARLDRRGRPRFAGYGRRLASPLEKIEDDPRYFVSPAGRQLPQRLVRVPRGLPPDARAHPGRGGFRMSDRPHRARRDRGERARRHLRATSTC